MKTKYKGVFILAFIHIGILLVAAVLGLFALAGDSLAFLNTCPFSIICLYCPGCGGTRALKELLSFNIVSSFLYNPNPLLWAGVLLYIDIRTVIIFAGKKVYDRVYFNKRLFILLIAVYFGNFLLKNILMVFFGIDPIGDYGEVWAKLMA